MGASQQRRARRAEKCGEQQVIDPAQQAAAKSMQDSKSSDELENSDIYHRPGGLMSETLSDRQEHTSASGLIHYNIETLSNPYHMVGGIAPESFFDTPSANSTRTKRRASVQVAEAGESDIHEMHDRTVHSPPPSFKDTDSETAEPTTSPVVSIFAAANTSFTFGSSSTFPCDFGKKQPLVDFAAVFNVSHLETHAKGFRNPPAKSNSIFNAIQSRILRATTPLVFETNTTPKPLAPPLTDDVERSLTDDEEQSNIAMAIEIPHPLAVAHCAQSSETVHHQIAADSVLAWGLVVPLVQTDSSLYAVFMDEMTNIVSSKLAAWARDEAERLETEYQRSLWAQNQPPCNDVEQTMALILYRRETPSPTEPDAIPSRSSLSEEKPLNRWPAMRVFFSDTEGNTRVIDCRKMMYDIEVMSDNGATDFDSIASPLKIIPRSISYSKPTTASTPDDSDDSIDIEDIGHFEIGATFHTHISDWNDAVSTSDTSMSFDEDEDVVDPRLVFLPTKQVQVIELADESESHQHDPVEIIQDIENEELLISHVLEDVHESPGAELSATNIPLSEGSYGELSDELPLGQPPILSLVSATGEEDVSTISLEPFPDFYVDLPDPAMFGDDASDNPESAEASSQALPEWLTENLKDDVCTVRATDAFSSGWASELMRMTMGSESFFTFLMQLDTIEENVTTKGAVVETFLELVDMERKKLGRNILPSSCTAASVLASKIVPHTIFLGNISLASFIADLSFDDEGKVAVEEIYHVFKTLSAADLQYQATASTGILGALGRRLGKILV